MQAQPQPAPGRARRDDRRRAASEQARGSRRAAGARPCPRSAAASRRRHRHRPRPRRRCRDRRRRFRARRCASPGATRGRRASSTTDAEGVFTLTKVPSGSLTLMAEKATYLPTMYPERRRTMRALRPERRGRPDDRQHHHPMSRGGAITGRVVDAYGDPVENVMVQAISAPQNDRRRCQLASAACAPSSASNDIGEYRISRLEPGQYFLLATPQRRPMAAARTAAARPDARSIRAWPRSIRPSRSPWNADSSIAGSTSRCWKRR